MHPYTIHFELPLPVDDQPAIYTQLLDSEERFVGNSSDDRLEAWMDLLRGSADDTVTAPPFSSTGMLMIDLDTDDVDDCGGLVVDGLDGHSVFSSSSSTTVT